jgi:hypothetical protein
MAKQKKPHWSFADSIHQTTNRLITACDVMDKVISRIVPKIEEFEQGLEGTRGRKKSIQVDGIELRAAGDELSAARAEYTTTAQMYLTE